MAARLVAAKLAPTLIITSPATRALATARILASALGYAAERIREPEDAYLASPAELLDLVHRLGGRSRHVMLVGHNPGLTDFANLLTASGIDNIPTCGVLVADLAVDSWREAGPGCGESVLYVVPKALPS